MRKKLLKYAAALAALGIMGLAMSITSHAAQTAAETAEINRQAVTAYRTKLREYLADLNAFEKGAERFLEYGWNYAYGSFYVVDLNGDGILEAIVNLETPNGNYGSQRVLYYMDQLKIQEWSTGVPGASCYNPSKGVFILSDGHVGGNGAISHGYKYYVYQYDGENLQMNGSFGREEYWESGNAEWRKNGELTTDAEAILGWLENYTEGTLGLNSVSLNQENINLYLSDDGQATPTGQSYLYENIFRDVYGL